MLLQETSRNDPELAGVADSTATPLIDALAEDSFLKIGRAALDLGVAMFEAKAELNAPGGGGEGLSQVEAFGRDQMRRALEEPLLQLTSGAKVVSTVGFTSVTANGVAEIMTPFLKVTKRSGSPELLIFEAMHQSLLTLESLGSGVLVDRLRMDMLKLFHDVLEARDEAVTLARDTGVPTEPTEFPKFILNPLQFGHGSGGALVGSFKGAGAKPTFNDRAALVASAIGEVRVTNYTRRYLTAVGGGAPETKPKAKPAAAGAAAKGDAKAGKGAGKGKKARDADAAEGSAEAGVVRPAETYTGMRPFTMSRGAVAKMMDSKTVQRRREARKGPRSDEDHRAYIAMGQPLREAYARTVPERAFDPWYTSQFDRRSPKTGPVKACCPHEALWGCRLDSDSCGFIHNGKGRLTDSVRIEVLGLADELAKEAEPRFEAGGKGPPLPPRSN